MSWKLGDERRCSLVYHKTIRNRSRDEKEIVQEMTGECAVGSGEVGYVDQTGIVDGRGIDAYKMDN